MNNISIVDDLRHISIILDRVFSTLSLRYSLEYFGTNNKLLDYVAISYIRDYLNCNYFNHKEYFLSRIEEKVVPPSLRMEVFRISSNIAIMFDCRFYYRLFGVHFIYNDNFVKNMENVVLSMAILKDINEINIERLHEKVISLERIVG